MSRYISTNYQWGIDNGGGHVVVFGQGATLPSGSRVAITEVTGLDMPEINPQVTPLSNADGATVGALYHSERTITLAGYLSTTASLYGQDTAYLRGITASPRRTGSNGVLEFQFPGMPAQIVNGFFTSLKYAVRTVETAVGYVEILLTMVCGDPRIYSSASSAGSGSTLNPGGTSGGKVFPITFPFSFSTSASGSATVTNSGNYYAPTTITLNGPLTNPKVTNTTTGVSQQFLMAISSGSSLVVNSLDRTILLGGSSRYSSMVSGGDFIELAPGSNSLTLAVDSGAGTGTITYSDTWV